MAPTHSRRILPVPIASGWGISGAVVVGLALPAGAGMMDAVTAAFVHHVEVRVLFCASAAVGLLTVGVFLQSARKSLVEHWRFWRLRAVVDALRTQICEGQPTGAAQDRLADLIGPLHQLGVFDREPLPGLGNVIHLRTALAALDNCMRRWALNEARDTQWRSAYEPE